MLKVSIICAQKPKVCREVRGKHNVTGTQSHRLLGLKIPVGHSVEHCKTITYFLGSPSNILDRWMTHPLLGLNVTWSECCWVAAF